MNDTRAVSRQRWIQSVLGEGFHIEPLAGDASFRRYFRIHKDSTHSFVLMDAPPEHEDVEPFLAVRSWLEGAGLRVSHLHAEDRSLGFLLLEDFGDRTWATHCLQGADMKPLFDDALRQLQVLQQGCVDIELADFDMMRMHRECDLYLDWYLPKVAGMTPTQQQRKDFHGKLQPWLQTLQDLPFVPVHLDYHSRNLMLPPNGLPLAIIDFQDAVVGPVTYDLASLLYDCYQDYPEDERLRWSASFFAILPNDIRQAFANFDDWHRKLRMTALQRHIKAIGIFSRLAYRDGKRQFLDELPLTQRHLKDEMSALGMNEQEYPLLFV